MTARKDPSTYLKMGAPTKYKPEFCEMLVKHMSEGGTFTSFAAVVGTHHDALYEWCKIHPDFAEAKKLGFDGCHRFYEQLGKGAMLGKIPGFNATAFVWMTKNILRWRDRHDVEISGKDGGPVKYADMTEEELDARIKRLTEI